MFTFGIFTTHFPYIAVVAFYAYFLFFGVDKISDGSVKVADKSHTIQIHNNNSVQQAPADTFRFYASLLEETETFAEQAKVKQKWKHFSINNNFPKEHPENALFGRPPPYLA